MLTKDLIAQFSIAARTEYNKAYDAYDPKFSDLLYEYPSGPVASVDFVFFGFLQGMERFTGSRIHQTFPEGYKFTIRNEEWDMAVDIKRVDIDRAAGSVGLAGLNPYLQRISEMPAIVKDHPVELAFDMLEAGDASTYGTTFDGQTFFDTDHAYGTSAGTMSNIITNGSGVSVANLITDLGRVLSRFQTFTYQQGGNSATSKTRKLNKSFDRILVVCPTELYAAFNEIRTKGILASGEENVYKGTFDLISLPFTDATDWYAINLSENGPFKPFLYQVEKAPVLDYPTEQDESARERKTYTWGAYGRYNVAYGAWWTAIMIQNS